MQALIYLERETIKNVAYKAETGGGEGANQSEEREIQEEGAAKAEADPWPDGATARRLPHGCPCSWVTAPAPHCLPRARVGRLYLPGSPAVCT